MIRDAPLARRGFAGYRVLRSLSREEDSEVLVGFRHGADDGADAAAHDAESPGPPRSVALKVAPATPEQWRRLLHTMEALDRAQGEHVMAVLDVDVDDGTACLVTERLTRGSLSELVALRGRLDAGEVVTILAPLVGALHEMHASGVAHGAVSTRTVMFRSNGAPVLIGFGRASLFAPASPEVVLEREPGVAADRRAIVELAILLLARVDGTRGSPVLGLLAELDSCQGESVLPMLASRLFDLAAAMPVRFAAEEQSPWTTTRVVPLAAPVHDTIAERASGVGRALEAIVPEALLRRVVATVVSSPLSPVLAAAARRWRSWPAGRRRLSVGAAAAATALAVTLAVVPGPPSRASVSPGVATVSPAVTAPEAVGSANMGGATTGHSANSESDAISGNDPRAAGSALARARDRCLRSLSLLCLEQVDQTDSGALRDDRVAVRRAQQGGQVPDQLLPPGGALGSELVERLGDSALIRLSYTAPADTSSAAAVCSLLIVRGDAGWRIRDVLAVAPPDG
jgi:serine/threonine protein kinase